MKSLKFGFSYIIWHYTAAFSDVSDNCKNLLWFLLYFFSIPVLAKTVFSPWKRMDVDRGRIETVGDKFGRILINFIMRMVGALMRTILILVGLLVILATVLCEIGFFIIWVALPVLIAIFFIKGMVLVL